MAICHSQGPLNSPDQDTGRSDHVLLAISVIVITGFALSLGDALVKSASNQFVLWQIFLMRSVIAVPCLIVFTLIFARGALRMPHSLGWTIFRSLLLVIMWVSYYFSLVFLPISVAAAAYYTLPIFITIFSALVTGDKIKAGGWVAAILGFLGVLLVIKPNATDFNVYALLPLLSAILYALAMVLTRTKCQSAHPLFLALALNVAFFIVGGAAVIAISLLPSESREGFLLAPWRVMGPSQWLSMSLLAVAILIGSIGAAFAYQNGPPSVVGVFDFSYVGFAVLWGVIFFSDFPDAISLAGIALIVLAGVISFRQ